MRCCRDVLAELAVSCPAQLQPVMPCGCEVARACRPFPHTLSLWHAACLQNLDNLVTAPVALPSAVCTDRPGHVRQPGCASSRPGTGSPAVSVAAPDPGIPAAQVMRKEPSGGRASHLLVPLATLVSSGLLGAVSGILLGLQVGGSASGRRWPAAVKRLPSPAQKW